MLAFLICSVYLQWYSVNSLNNVWELLVNKLKSAGYNKATLFPTLLAASFYQHALSVFSKIYGNEVKVDVTSSLRRSLGPERKFYLQVMSFASPTARCRRV